MTDQEPEATEPPPEPEPEPLKFDPPDLDYIEKGGDDGDIETSEPPDTEHK